MYAIMCIDMPRGQQKVLTSARTHTHTHTFVYSFLDFSSISNISRESVDCPTHTHTPHTRIHTYAQLRVRVGVKKMLDSVNWLFCSRSMSSYVAVVGLNFSQGIQSCSRGQGLLQGANVLEVVGAAEDQGIQVWHLTCSEVVRAPNCQAEGIQKLLKGLLGSKLAHINSYSQF